MFKRRAGDAGERKAEQFLKRNGLKFVARNWHCRHGEIDLVMFDGEYLVFVEVRLRTPRGFANSAESVPAAKPHTNRNAFSQRTSDPTDRLRNPTARNRASSARRSTTFRSITVPSPIVPNNSPSPPSV